MFYTTIIKKSVTGIMQSSGGFAESISRALGLRVRTAAGSVIELSHDDSDATLQVTPGNLLINADELKLGGLQIPPASTGNTASRPGSPVLGQEYFDSDLDDWIKWNGSEWRYLTGVAP